MEFRNFECKVMNYNSNFKINELKIQKNELKMKDKRAKSKIIQQSPLQRNAAAGSWLLFVGRGFT